ncbi:MAG TPA: SRPBCC family protein [Polyangiaceae bacterium]|nr:SRPBCC family protein [Polyangiaceae bacterium]
MHLRPTVAAHGRRSSALDASNEIGSSWSIIGPMQTEARAQVEISATPEVVFDAGADYRNFTRFIHAYGPIPGIRSAVMLGGAAPGTGSHREIHLSDGSTIEEAVLAFERPARHRYRLVHPPAMPFRLIVGGGEGDWRFEPSPHGPGTRVTWTYRLQLTTPLVWPMAMVLRALFGRWMQQALERLRGLVEAGS